MLAGNPAERIVEYATEEDVGLIIMATHGRSGISRWALGSVANKVIRATDKPVALIRSKGVRPDVRKKGILKKVLVPLDGSKESEAVIPHIEELASKLETEIFLLQVVPRIYQTIACDGYDAIIPTESDIESNRVLASNYLEKVAAKLQRKNVTVKSKVEIGIVSEEIIRLAEEMSVDMVAMSTHGRSGIGRWVFGSIADRVLHYGNTPLLLVRPR